MLGSTSSRGLWGVACFLWAASVSACGEDVLSGHQPAGILGRSPSPKVELHPDENAIFEVEDGPSFDIVGGISIRIENDAHTALLSVTGRSRTGDSIAGPMGFQIDLGDSLQLLERLSNGESVSTLWGEGIAYPIANSRQLIRKIESIRGHFESSTSTVDLHFSLGGAHVVGAPTSEEFGATTTARLQGRLAVTCSVLDATGETAALPIAETVRTDLQWTTAGCKLMQGALVETSRINPQSE